jgi:UDP-MurNAc hydroxylase
MQVRFIERPDLAAEFELNAIRIEEEDRFRVAQIDGFAHIDPLALKAFSTQFEIFERRDFERKVIHAARHTEGGVDAGVVVCWNTRDVLRLHEDNKLVITRVEIDHAKRAAGGDARQVMNNRRKAQHIFIELDRCVHLVRGHADMRKSVTGHSEWSIITIRSPNPPVPIFVWYKSRDTLMRVHFIGHASLLIEADGVTILMDPVFWDPNYEGTNAMCPQREVNLKRLPLYDVIVVSHRHLDHFDIRTLASLDRRCTVLIPDRDPLLENSIKRLGFERRLLLQDKQSAAFGGATLTPTPSKANIREVGLVVRDSTGAVWNQVDTIIDSAIACDVADGFGPFDLLLAPWQPLLESEVLTNGRTSFPFERYFKQLSNVQFARPRTVIPSACGFKYCGEGEWLNKFVFPATREMFMRDVSALVSGVQVMAPNPGDIVDIRHRGATLHPCASPFVRTVRDDLADTTFDPTGAVPELSDANPHASPDAEMLSAIEAFFASSLMPILRTSLQQGRIACEYQRLGVVYQLDVVFPSHTRSWSIDFGRDLALESHPSATAHIHSRITASVLIDLITGLCSANYVFGGGFYRWSHRVYVVEEHGIYRWTPASEHSVLDPLWMALDPNALFEKYIEREIDTWLRERQT